ncbi:flavodoxin family protein [Gymnodinialimonas hymeniacidonis]|uniref:flavodoxin family protein n=1 Tax=Gymnodinialimonas hymeniacidonis TaxID=3126508 RepID=UPI0034C65CA7
MICIVYFSGTGHTRMLAQAVAEGAEEVQLIDVEAMGPEDWVALDAAEAIIFGAPTYMGSTAARFDMFLEEAASRWDTGLWADKVAAGFTVAVHPSGDKMNALVRLAVFAAQMGMIWVGQSEIGAPVKPEREGINRDGSWLGLMATDPVSEGDKATARLFGARVAGASARWAAGGCKVAHA